MRIKYLDQRRIAGLDFKTVDQIKAVRPSIVEAVGYLVKEDDAGYMIASTINGAAYTNLLFIPRGMVVELDAQDNGVEIEYHETQGMPKQIGKDKIAILPEPPTVKLCGMEVYRDEEVIALAQEKNQTGEYRVTIIVPLKSIIK